MVTYLWQTDEVVDDKIMTQRRRRRCHTTRQLQSDQHSIYLLIGKRNMCKMNFFSSFISFTNEYDDDFNLNPINSERTT